MTQHLITTHNAAGQAIFSQSIPTTPHIRTPPGTSQAKNSINIIYSTNTLKPNLSTEADIEAYSDVRKNGLPAGKIHPENGIATILFTLGPEYESPTHRTMTSDVIYVIEGVVELRLDGGEMKVVKAGDTIVQRGTMHQWKNITENGGTAKMFAVAIPIEEPIEIGGKQLGDEWLH